MYKIFNFFKIYIITFCFCISTNISISLLSNFLVLIGLINPFSLVITLPLLFYYKYNILCYILLLIFVINKLFKLISKNIYFILTYYTLVICSIYIVLNNYNNLSYIISITFLLMIPFIFVINEKLDIKNKTLFEFIIILLAITNLIISNKYLFLLLPLITYLYFNINKYVYVVTVLSSLLISFFVYNIKIPLVMFLSLILMSNNILLFIMFVLYNIYYLNYDYLLIIKTIFPYLSIYTYYLIFNKQIDYIKTDENLQNNCIKILDTYLLNNQDTLQTIDTKMNFLYNKFCKDCKKKDSCYKFKKTTNKYLYLCVTIDTDLKNTNLSNNLKTIINNCPYYNQMNSYEKVKHKQIDNNLVLNQVKTILNTYIPHTYIDKKLNILPNKFKSLGYKIKDYSYSLANNIMTITFKNNNNYNPLTLEKIAANYINKNLISYDNKTYITLTYRPKINISYEHNFIAKNNYLLCGDNYLIKNDNKNTYYFALSDGMGSGFNAFYKSNETIKMIEDILSLNLEFKKVVSLINTIHQMKYIDELYSTLDILMIDCVNSIATLYKFGSATSYIIKNNKVFSFYNESLPVGISTNPTKYTFKVAKDDIIILLSDGITDLFTKDMLDSLLLKLQFKSCTTIVKDILDESLKLSNNKPLDDMSVIGIKIT